jgi:hypothetical protein
MKPHIKLERTHRGNPYWACNMNEGLNSVRGAGSTPKEAFDSWLVMRAWNKQVSSYDVLSNYAILC